MRDEPEAQEVLLSSFVPRGSLETCCYHDSQMRIHTHTVHSSTELTEYLGTHLPHKSSLW